MKRLINEEQLLHSDIEDLTEEERQMIANRKVITEYVETGEGRGISIRPINEKLKDIDGKEIIMD